MIALVFPSPKKQDVSNLALRKVNSINTPPIKDYVAKKGEDEQYEYKSKCVRVNKSCVTPTKKNSRGVKKDHGKFGSEKFNQGKLAKQFSIRKN